MGRLSEERQQQLKHHAECGTNDATPPEIRKLVVALEQARADYSTLSGLYVVACNRLKELGETTIPLKETGGG